MYRYPIWGPVIAQLHVWYMADDPLPPTRCHGFRWDGTLGKGQIDGLVQDCGISNASARLWYLQY